MRLRAAPCDLRRLQDQRTDLALACVFEDERPFRGIVGQFSYRLAGRLEHLAQSGVLTGQLGEKFLFGGSRKLPSARLMLLGLGERSRLSPYDCVEATRALSEQATRLLAKNVMVELPGRNAGERTLGEALEVFFAVWNESEFDEVVLVDAEDKALADLLLRRRRF